MVVAGEAGKRQVVQIVTAVVLESDDVIDLEWQAIELLWQEQYSQIPFARRQT